MGGSHDVTKGALFDMVTIWLIAEIVSDFGIAGMLSWLLLRRRGGIAVYVPLPKQCY